MTADDVTSAPGRSHRGLQRAQRDTVRELIHGSMSCEFASIRDGKPTVFPLTPFYDAAKGSIVVSSPLAYAGKIANIEHDSRVSLLLHDSAGEYSIQGNATVRNADPEANAAYIHELSDAEPATPKRSANEKKYEFIESRIGNVLMGWAGKRVAIEIEPVSMTRIADSSPIKSIPPWPAAEMDRTEAREYERAVLTVIGSDGYPAIRPIVSVRIHNGAASIETEPSTRSADGEPACLLFHWHDDDGVYLRQRIVRGRFQTVEGSLRFVPGSCSTLRNESPLSTLRFMIDGKRRTRAYFERQQDERSPAGGTAPPGPDGLPLLGNTLQFIRDPFAFYESLPSYGSVVRYTIAGNTWTALLHPDDVERVLVNESDRFRRYNFEEFGFDVISEGLFFTDGEQWRRQRKAIQPAFAPAKIAPFGETIVTRTVRTVDGWSDGDTIAADHVFSDLTLEILTTTLFDLDLDERRAVVTEAARALADRADTRSLSAILPSWVPTRQNKRFNRAMAEFDTLVEALIEERRSERIPREDLLSTLLELRNPDRDGGTAEQEDRIGYTFTDEELRDQLVTFLFAGHETSALALTYAFLLIEQHDDVRGKLDAELEAVCGDRDPTVDDIPSLEYTEMVLKETMRYYPPVYVLFREAREDVTIDGDLIPEGTKLTLPQFILHRDERWWNDPLEFRPERWAGGLDDDVPEYAYFPFGGGPRHCVGMRFGTLLLTLVLATIARRVRFDIESDPEPDLRMAAMLTPETDVELAVRKR